jgi:hypothetical protein
MDRSRSGSNERSCDQGEEDDADGRGGEPLDGRRPSGEALTATSVEDGRHARGDEERSHCSTHRIVARGIGGLGGGFVGGLRGEIGGFVGVLLGSRSVGSFVAEIVGIVGAIFAARGRIGIIVGARAISGTDRALAERAGARVSRGMGMLSAPNHPLYGSTC